MNAIKQILPLILIYVLFTSIAFSQVKFEKLYNFTNSDNTNALLVTSDNHYLIGGNTDDSFFLIKCDSVGDTLWSSTYHGPTGSDICHKILEAADGNYIVMGRTFSAMGYWNILLTKINLSGDTLWTRVFGTGAGDGILCIKHTNDGGFIMAGETSVGGDADGFIIKTDSLGLVTWAKRYNGIYSDEFFDIIQTHDSNFVATGVSDSYGAGNNDVYLVKINSLGDTLWTRDIGDTIGIHQGKQIVELPDGDLAIVLDITRWGFGFSDVGLLKLDSSGMPLYCKLYQTPGDDFGQSIVTFNDSNFVILCNFGSSLALISANSNGDTLWTKIYNDQNATQATELVKTLDGGYAILGNQYYIQNSSYLVKTDSMGVSSCAFPSLVLNVDTCILTTLPAQGLVTNEALITDNVSYSRTGGSFNLNPCVSNEVDNINQPSFEIFPNPASENVFVTSKNRIQKIFVFDLTGKCCKSMYSDSNKINIDVKDLNPGIYFLRSIFENGVAEKQIAIVN